MSFLSACIVITRAIFVIAKGLGDQSQATAWYWDLPRTTLPALTPQATPAPSFCEPRRPVARLRTSARLPPSCRKCSELFYKSEQGRAEALPDSNKSLGSVTNFHSI